MESPQLQASSSVTVVPQISDRYAGKLAKLEVFTLLDLVTHFPRYHKDTTKLSTIDQAVPGEDLTIKATIEKIASVRIKGGRTLQNATVVDENGEVIKATWFNQPYLVRALGSDSEYLLTGKIKDYRGKLTFFPNNFEQIRPGKEQLHLGRLSPQYKLTSGVTIKWIRTRIKYVLDNTDQIEGFNQSLQELNKPLSNFLGQTVNLLEDIKEIHFPTTEEQFEAAKYHLQLLELVNLQIKLKLELSSREVFHAPKITLDTKRISKFVSSLEFKLTGDQNAAVATVLTDIAKQKSMNRLVQGDVGTGKTIVATIAALAVASAGYQTVFLAPTTVLASQHHKSLRILLADQDLKIELITTNTKAEFDEADIIIGTSAVLARKMDLLKNPGLIVVDEQHKFGVSQREELLQPFELEPNKFPHFLDMTATPIPRTLAIALFSDLSVSTIKDKPQGRLPIKSFVVPDKKRENSYEWIKERVVEHEEQVYWVCPLIEESEKLEIASAKQTFENLSNHIYPDLNIGLLHGRLKNTEKEAIMDRFKAGEIQILVSTSVIEVGVDVANATVMVIEGADRFGLAQLHQIRGRVGRSDQQSWCFIFLGAEVSDEASDRLDFFSKNSDGLKISEYDLQRRGPGEVYGTKQSGIPNFKIASFDNLEQIEQSKDLSKLIMDGSVTSIPLFD